MTYIKFDDKKQALARSKEMWETVLVRKKNPEDVTEFLYGVQERPAEPDPEHVETLPDGVDVAIVITERDGYLDKLVATEKVTATEAITVAELYPAWESGTAYSVDDIVTYGDDLYVVRQAHSAQADWQPPSVLALYRVYRKDADTTLDWIASERVEVGWHRMYAGTEYECIQAHVTQSDWTPPVVPALWAAVVAPTAEWSYPIAYKVGDIVTYQGQTYQCRQSHTSQAGWSPPVVLALWLPL